MTTSVSFVPGHRVRCRKFVIEPNASGAFNVERLPADPQRISVTIVGLNSGPGAAISTAPDPPQSFEQLFLLPLNVPIVLEGSAPLWLVSISNFLDREIVVIETLREDEIS